MSKSECSKRYYKKHKEKLIEKGKKYYLEHKEHLSSLQKIRYYKNREERLAHQKLYREQNKERRREIEKASNKRCLPRKKERQKELRKKVMIYYGGDPPKCACCGELNIEFLSLNHINNDGAKHRRKIGKSTVTQTRWVEKNGYPPIFNVLCMNCNWSKGIWGYCPHENERLAN